MVELDTSNGVMFPLYDADTNMVYLCGKVSCLFVSVNWISWFSNFSFCWFEFRRAIRWFVTSKSLQSLHLCTTSIHFKHLILSAASAWCPNAGWTSLRAKLPASSDSTIPACAKSSPWLYLENRSFSRKTCIPILPETRPPYRLKSGSPARTRTRSSYPWDPVVNCRPINRIWK